MLGDSLKEKLTVCWNNQAARWNFCMKWKKLMKLFFIIPGSFDTA